MTLGQLKAALDAQPTAHIPDTTRDAVAHSLAYLASSEASASLKTDCYWPKWDSPWWHMLTLYEMGMAREIPESALQAMIDALERVPVHDFPIPRPGAPVSQAVLMDALCHCAVGSIYSVLSAAGVPVDRELPWLRPWFLRYQMEDGGLTCDYEAYPVEDECPSSMVGTIAAFEAVLHHVPNPSGKELEFLDRAAEFLIGRELRWGSPTRHNAEEVEAAQRWPLPCFPRLYFYDTLRGLHALLSWSEKRRKRLPSTAIVRVVQDLLAAFPDGQVAPQRHGYEGVGSRTKGPDGRWNRVPLASTFPLLQEVSALQRPSPFLTRRWNECKEMMQRVLFEPVQLVPHDPGWEGEARLEGERFGALLGDNLIAVHHIGSTSIPGIEAKPVLDLAPEVKDVSQLDALQSELEAHGYEYWGEYGLPGRRFCPLHRDGVRIANIHCYGTGTPELKRHLAFRDYLRAHPEVAREYEAVKQRARDLHPLDVFAYNDEKNPWIRRVELQAIAWAKSRSQS